MKFHFLSFFLFASVASVRAQYYYNDIVGTQQTNLHMRAFADNKVKSVSADGYTPQGAKATDFAEVQEVRDNGRSLRVVTISNGIRTTSYSRFDDQYRITSVTDSSMGVENTTTYEYDNGGRLIKVQNSVKDPENEIGQLEVHQWIYNKDGKPEKMWSIVNKTDSLEIRFIPDENGNPGEEIAYRRGRETDHVYYYFDDPKKNLTDIVRFDNKAKKLIPENILTYDDNGNIIQSVVKSEKDNIGLGAGKAYFVRYTTWRYVYNEKSLKTAEALFNPAQEMTGRIKYTYTFAH